MERDRWGQYRPSARGLRNELFVRIADATLAWIDAVRGEEARSTYVRKVLERESQRDHVGKGADAED